MTERATIRLEHVGKVYPGREQSLRGTKLEWQGPALWIRNASRAFGWTSERTAPVTALDDVTFSALSGEVVGLYGPNGSGKTTLIKVIAGLVRPSSGTGEVAGVPLDRPQDIRRRVTYVSTTGWMGLEWALTAQENIRFFGLLCGMSGAEARARTEEALRALDLWEDRNKLVGALSNGMRQRVMLARAFLIRTPVVLLDEPLVGLDPDHRDDVLHLIRTVLPGRGQTVILADHQTEALQRWADRVAVLREGRLVAWGTPAELISRVKGLRVLDVWTELGGDPGPPPAVVRRATSVSRPGPLAPTHWRLAVLDAEDVLTVVLEWLERAGARVVGVEEREPSLEDVAVYTAEGRASA
jgi:ABC-2 type transport system ATP-binding protein